MSFFVYDEALKLVLKKLLPNTHYTQQPLGIEEASKLTDSTIFPMMSFYTGNIRIRKEGTSRSMAKYSTILQGIKDGKSVSLNAIPFYIEWQVDLYDPDKRVVDEMVRELIFFLTDKPFIWIEIPYGLNQQVGWNIDYDENIVDNSDLVEFKETGRVYRKTVTLFTDEAWLFKTNLAPSLAYIDIKVNDEVLGSIEIRGEDVVPNL